MTVFRSVLQLTYLRRKHSAGDLYFSQAHSDMRVYMLLPAESWKK
jgi:hypothetical protein